MHKVPVVIVSYKTSHLIQTLVDSINEDSVDVAIVVLDNGSTDETYAILQQIKDERIVLIRSEHNLGFAGGVNHALKYVSDNFSTAAYCFLLNPDAVCTANTIGGMLQILIQQSDAACISPQIVNEDGNPGYSGGRFDFKRGVVTTAAVVKPEKENAAYEVDVFTGCAVLLNIERTKEVGMFDESLFMYFDEADISLKYKKSGYKVLYTPKYKVFHDHSYTTRKSSFIKTYYMSRNRFKVFHATMPLSYKFYFLIHEFAYHLKYKRIKNALYHLKGVYHYYTGRMGNGFVRNT